MDSSRKFINSTRREEKSAIRSSGADSSVMEAPEEYEELLRQYEASVRNHI